MVVAVLSIVYAEFPYKVLSKLEWCGQGFKSINLQRRPIPVDRLTWQSFVDSKKLIAQGPVLYHFYSQFPTTLQVDVSSDGVGGRFLQNDQSVLSFLNCTAYMNIVLPRSGIVHDYVRSCLTKRLRIIMNPIVSVHTFNEL